MPDIDRLKIRWLDMTVLLIFLGLMRHRKATAVAADLGLTQSSVSHALRRLREVFDDELFLRRPHGLEPTAFAIAVEPQIQAALETLQRAVSGPGDFDPATARLTLRLSALDHTVATLLADLVTRLRAEAPGVRVSVRALGRREAIAALKDGAIDCALGYFWEVPEGIERRALGPERYRVVARQGHPALAEGLSLAAYCACEHIVVSTDGSLWGVADRALKAVGAERNLVAAVPQFLTALALVARSDFLALLPASMVARFAPGFGLAVHPPPFDLRPFEISALWHRRDARRAELAWLLGHLAHVAAENLLG